MISHDLSVSKTKIMYISSMSRAKYGNFVLFAAQVNRKGFSVARITSTDRNRVLAGTCNVMAFTISSKSFYSKRESKLSQDIKKKLEEAEEKLKKYPLPPELPSSLLGPSSRWLVFARQDEALRIAKEYGLMTFAFEERIPGSGGRRKFLVTDPSNMWRRHIARPAEDRCTYEVIPQGAPCKLYYDLEFDKTVNKSCNAEAMVESLIAATLLAFKEVYNVTVLSSDVLILDATTNNKFSQHLVFQTRGLAFQDNSHAGNFVKFIVNQLKEKAITCLSQEEQEKLFVDNTKNELVSFCDLGVYTKNRNFRLFLSSKFGKNAPLVIARTNAYMPEPYTDEALFKASLITYFNDENIHLLRHQTVDGQPENSHSNADRLSSSPRLNGYQYSPWIEIDQFIETLVLPGTIRRWVYYEKTEVIVYDIQGYRYCANIGREHKRNHIKYVVNLPNGTYYQSCFDQDCSEYRPTPQPIPAEHLPWNGLLDDEDTDAITS